jgi:hypothetical protein
MSESCAVGCAGASFVVISSVAQHQRCWGGHPTVAVRDGALGGRLERGTAALIGVTALAKFDSES